MHACTIYEQTVRERVVGPGWRVYGECVRQPYEQTVTERVVRLEWRVYGECVGQPCEQTVRERVVGPEWRVHGECVGQPYEQTVRKRVVGPEWRVLRRVCRAVSDMRLRPLTGHGGRCDGWEARGEPVATGGDGF